MTGEPKVKFQKVLGFYDVSRLFIRIRNCCTTVGHNYRISADVVHVVECVCVCVCVRAFSWKSKGCVSVCLSRSKEGVSYIHACCSVCMCLCLTADVYSSA